MQPLEGNDRAAELAALQSRVAVLEATLAQQQRLSAATTARLQAEIAERSRAEAILRTFYDSAPLRMGVVELLDDDIRFVVVNQYFCVSTGLSREAVEGRTTRELNLDAPSCAIWLTHYRQAWAARHPIQFSIDEPGFGELRSFCATVTPIGDPTTEPPRCSFVVLDVTRRRAAEEQRLLSEQRFRTALEATPAACAIYNRELQISYANRRAIELSGYSWKEVIGRRDEELYDPGVNYDYVDVARQVFATGQAAQVELEFTGAVPSVIMDISYVPLYDQQGEIYEVLALAFDVTHHKQTEQQLRESLAEKEALIKEVHHRVKNNLQIVSSLLDLQSMTLDDPVAAQRLTDSRQRVRTMALVHEQLYRSATLSRVDFARYLQTLVRHVGELYQPLAEQIVITTTAADVYLDVATAIPCGLIVNELLTNALQHAFPTRQSGTIRVTSTTSGEVLSIVVNDDGCGFTADSGSQGIGLYLVQILAQQLRGKAEFLSAGGTRVTLTIPLKTVENR